MILKSVVIKKTENIGTNKNMEKYLTKTPVNFKDWEIFILILKIQAFFQHLDQGLQQLHNHFQKLFDHQDP